MKSLPIWLLLLFIVFSSPLQGRPSQTGSRPDTSKIELTAEELAWWKAVESAGAEAVRRGKAVENQIAAHRQRNLAATRAESLKHVAPEVLQNFQNARDMFVRLLEEGIEKKFRSPVENAKPKLLFAPRPLYTPEARAQKICGTATVQVEVAQNGVPTSATLRKSVQKRCPEAADVNDDGRIRTEPISANPPPLGNGLDEEAVEVGMRMIFLPAIRDHRPVAASPAVEVNFNIFL